MAFTEIETDIVVTPLVSYIELTDKPTINGVELAGELESADLGLQPEGQYLVAEDIEDLSMKDLSNVNVGTQNAGKAVYVAEDGTLEFR